MSKAPNTPYDLLAAFQPQPRQLSAVVETPKEHRIKYKYDPMLGLFRINRMLPAGAVFPFDFGFIPATLGQDGDPLDVLILLDETAFAGCLVPSRLIGVIEAEVKENGRVEWNDRLVAVATESVDNKDL